MIEMVKQRIPPHTHAPYLYHKHEWEDRRDAFFWVLSWLANLAFGLGWLLVGEKYFMIGFIVFATIEFVFLSPFPRYECEICGELR